MLHFDKSSRSNVEWRQFARHRSEEKLIIFGKSFFEALGQEFPIGPIMQYEELAWGSPNICYLLETRKGRFVLKIEDLKSGPEIKQEIELLLFLRQNGFPCPQPISTCAGKYWVDHDGRFVSVYRNVEGHKLSAASLTLEQLENIGRTLADLHVIGKGFKKGIDNRFSFARVASIYQEVKKLLPTHMRGIIRVLDDEFNYLEHYSGGNLAKGVIHGNLVPENLRFKGVRVIGVVEFGAACRSEMIYDVASFVNFVCFAEERYQLDRFESLLDGYEQVRPLSLPEWDCFPNELRFSALRHTVTTMRDFFTGTASERLHVQKDFRGFFHRLLILRREREGGMEDLLMAMATGYDYRKVQKVKSVRIRGKTRFTDPA